MKRPGKNRLVSVAWSDISSTDSWQRVGEIAGDCPFDGCETIGYYLGRRKSPLGVRYWTIACSVAAMGTDDAIVLVGTSYDIPEGVIRGWQYLKAKGGVKC